MLAPAFGIAGVAGLLAGGILSDRPSTREASRRLWLCAVVSLLAIPLIAVSVFSHTPEIVVLFYGAAYCLGVLYAGPTIAMVCSVIPARNRAFSMGVLLFAMNLPGLGVGPLMVGLVSDALGGGGHALGTGMLMASLVYLPGAAFYFAASRCATADLASASVSTSDSVDVHAGAATIAAPSVRRTQRFGYIRGDHALARAACAEVCRPIHSAALAFGFVFIHPFIDGNGRLHRYLLHEELSVLGFTPKGIALPVSAFILAHLEDYIQVLEQFSRPLVLRTEFEPQLPDVPARGNDGVYFRFFDATAQALFLYRALERTVMHDLRDEIDQLIGLDRARALLRNEVDWPAHSLDLFINIVRQDGGGVSQTKRKSQFPLLTDDEIERFVGMVNEAFQLDSGAGLNS